MDLGDRVWRYELLDACRPIDDDHAHFLCESCGVVHCLPPLELRARDGQLPAVLRGADIRLRVTGVCVECTRA
jgi:Fe2+ or Zn2+ uptake regulation protein